MANIKSQIKRNKQNEKRRINNRNVRGASRTAVSQARASFEEKAPETKDLVLKAISELDKAAGKGVIHKNAAARRKGRLMKKLNTFVPAEAGEVTTKKASKKKK